MLSNAFFSTVVRVQSDRGHKVCRDGPYRFVRHPGYVGVLAGALLVVRTALEDRTLRTALAGHADYAARVRYRLAPGIW